MELKGRLEVFLQGLYRGVEYEVRVGELFDVTSDLRQGQGVCYHHCSSHCTLKLRAAKVGILCREQLVPALLFTNDMVTFAEGEDKLKRGLRVLDEWCREWGMKMNADICGVLHIKRMGVNRTSKFSVGGDMVGVVQS